MQTIFEAILKGNLLEWANEVPRQGNHPVRVYVPLLEEVSDFKCGVSPSEYSENIGKNCGPMDGVCSYSAIQWIWQRDLRQDRPLPGKK